MSQETMRWSSGRCKGTRGRLRCSSVGTNDWSSGLQEDSCGIAGMWKMRRRRRSSEHSGHSRGSDPVPHSAPGSPRSSRDCVTTGCAPGAGARWAGRTCPGRAAAATSVAAGAASGAGAANRDLAERVLTGVSPKERQILLLREVMGYTAAESAKALGCSELAARIRLHRARRAMQRVAERLLDGMDHSA